MVTACASSAGGSGASTREAPRPLTMIAEAAYPSVQAFRLSMK